MQRPISGDIFSKPSGSDVKVNILGGNSIGHCEKKNDKSVCLIVSGYREK